MNDSKSCSELMGRDFSFSVSFFRLHFFLFFSQYLTSFTFNNYVFLLVYSVHLCPIIAGSCWLLLCVD